MKKLKKIFYFEENQSKLTFVLTMPTILIVLLVFIYPVIYSLIISFTNIRLSHLGEYHFIGITNFINIFKDSRFISSIGITFKYTIISVFIKLFFGLMIAYVLNEKFIGRNIARVAIIIPWATPPIAAGILWRWMLDPTAGVLNFLLIKIGIIKNFIGFLSDTRFALYSIILVDFWQSVPFYVLILLAGLQTIPEDLYDAAKIDGAGGIRSFFAITIPNLKNQIFISITIGTIFSLSAFDLFYSLTRGGPMGLTTTMTLKAYFTSIESFNLAIGTSMAWIIMLITFIITLLYLFQLKRTESP
jgi:ABC-type sugar transport system permease subunit